jgi:predicted lipase
MSDSCLYIHEVLYDNLHIIRLNPNIRNTTRLKNSEIDIFAADLDKIIIGKKQWTLEAGQNEVENKLQSYRGFIEKNISRNIKEERQSVIEKTAKAIFKESNDIEEEFNSGEAYETMSNDEFKFNYSDKMTVFD